MKAENRQILLDAAQRVFCEAGFDGASVRDIIRESGLSPGTFYNHFDSKHELLGLVVDEFLNKVNRGIRESRKQLPDQNPRTLIANTLATFYHIAAEDEFFARLIVRNPQIYREMQITRRVALSRHLMRSTTRPAAVADIKEELINIANLVLFGAGFEILAYVSQNEDAGIDYHAEVLADFIVAGLEFVQKKYG